MTLKEFLAHHQRCCFFCKFLRYFACSLTAEKLFNISSSLTYHCCYQTLLSSEKCTEYPNNSFMAIPPTGIFSWNNICWRPSHFIPSVQHMPLLSASCQIVWMQSLLLQRILANADRCIAQKRLKTFNAIERAYPSTREEYIPSSSWQHLSPLEKI